MKPHTRQYRSANTSQPRVAILGSAPFTTIVTNGGGGQSRFGALAVTRWRTDGTLDDQGQWCYVKDVTTGKVWSAAHQPVCAEASSYRVGFESDRATFNRTDGDIDTQMEISVSVDNAAEMRRITLFNNSSAPREIELTSYSEVVIAPFFADRGHPAFFSLFVQTEWVKRSNAILAMRRPRAADSKPVWCGQVLSASGEQISCETDRAKFIGRGRSSRNPATMDQCGPLSGRVGAVLDPIFAIRTRVLVPAGGSAHATFTTFMAQDRDDAMRLAESYKDASRVAEAFDASRAEAQKELADLGVTAEYAAMYQELAGHLLFPDSASRTSSNEAIEEVVETNPGRTELLGLGISDLSPILLAAVRSADGLAGVNELLKVHRYWRLIGIACDLVILNEHPVDGAKEFAELLAAEVIASSESALLDLPGGVFIRRADGLDGGELAFLRSVTRLHVDCEGFSLNALLASLNVAERIEYRAPAVAESQSMLARAQGKAQEPDELGAGLQFFNGIGGFNSRNEYEINLTDDTLPPAPWVNVIANESAGFIASETGAGCTWAISSSAYRLTPWQNDPVSDRPGECIYIRDDSTGDLWSPTAQPIREPTPYTVRHGAGYSTFQHSHDGIATSLRMGVPTHDPVKLQVFSLTNTGPHTRNLTIASFTEWVLGATREISQFHVRALLDAATGVMLATNNFDSEFASTVAFTAISEPLTGHGISRREFLGRNGTLSSPLGLARKIDAGNPGDTVDPCAVLEVQIELAAGETKSIAIILGAANGREAALEMAERYRSAELANEAIDAAASAWRDRLSAVTVHTPEPAFDLMVNQWAFYQALSCRVWGRMAVYQSSGAYGFRDQLQDVMAFTYAEPALARDQIIRAASRQFEEGDVQHWWHPHSGRGIRTRFSDDLVWLPYVIDHYLRVTHDDSVFDERTPYLTMRSLMPDEDEFYAVPDTSKLDATIYEHCVDALARACTAGEHGLPLIGSGDWNDGMNRVGIEGKGESVWLAWFLITTLRAFAEHAEARGHLETAVDLRSKAEAYRAAVEHTSWDGEWYRRAYYDDGAPLGSHANDECQIDSIAQSWSVISKAGNAERSETAMRTLNKRLVRDDARLIMLLTPSFDRGSHDPGYIQGYLPGVRENGAQYTHAALWAVQATALQGDGDRAMELYQMINPITHATTPEEVSVYKVEPYVVAADVYTAEGHLGRGGWTWYTGSASWMYRVGLEAILGFTKRGDKLEINPCIPSAWKEFSIDYRYGGSMYAVHVRNPDGVQKGVVSVTVDGTRTGGAIPLVSDGMAHEAVVTMG